MQMEDSTNSCRGEISQCSDQHLQEGRMYQMKPEDTCQPHRPVHFALPAFHQQSCCNQTHFPVEFVQRSPLNLSYGAQNMFPLCMTCMQTPNLQSNAVTGHSVIYLPNVKREADWTASMRPVVHHPGPAADFMVNTQRMGSASDMTASQLRNPSSSLPLGVAEESAHGSKAPPEDKQKRELRLMKNREAARECRRKKKEYVKCLENRVAVLENQNKTLIEELRALKDIYRHKVEMAAIKSRRRRKEYIQGLKERCAVLEKENQTLKAVLLLYKNWKPS